ncbi:MAG: flippase [Candidatus Cloacimonetes bacterium]|nr:flippase [Candidatus Cloacimonadota bacterium]
MTKAIIKRLFEAQRHLHSTKTMKNSSRIFKGLISFFYGKIFHEPANEEVMKFFRNLSYVGLGTILSTIFSFSYNLIAGRVLGPSGYGGFTVVQSIAMFLYIPMLFGLHTAMMKYCAESKDQYQQHRILSTTYTLVICLTLASVLIYYIFRDQIAAIFSVNQEIVMLSIIFTVFFVFYTLATSSIRGLHLMRAYAIYQPIYGIILLSAFLIFISAQFYSFKAMVYSTCLAYGIVGLVITLRFLKDHLAFTIDRSWVPTLWKYSSLAVIGGLSFTLYTNIDRVMINYYMGFASVGIYAVYYYASFTVLTLISGIFTTVFFPTASRSQDKRAIYKKLNRTIPYLLILGIPIAITAEYVILLLFGKDYPLQLPLMLIFAVSAILVTWYGIYAWFFNSEGIEGSKLTVSGTLVIAITNVIFNVILIPLMGLYGAIGATTLAFALGLCYNFYYGKKFFMDPPKITDL